MRVSEIRVNQGLGVNCFLTDSFDSGAEIKYIETVTPTYVVQQN